MIGKYLFCHSAWERLASAFNTMVRRATATSICAVSQIFLGRIPHFSRKPHKRIEKRRKYLLSQVNLTISTISPFQADLHYELQMLLSKCPDWLKEKSWRSYLDHLLKIYGQFFANCYWLQTENEACLEHKKRRLRCSLLKICTCAISWFQAFVLHSTHGITCQSITLQRITLKDCNFEVICNPHVTRRLAKICGRTLTKRVDVRRT